MLLKHLKLVLYVSNVTSKTSCLSSVKKAHRIKTFEKV